MPAEERESRRILVVDDDEVMRDLLSALLQIHGYEVATAESGDAALTYLRGGNAPAVILTDLQMPGIEGEALTRALRVAAPGDAVLLGMSGRHPSAAVLDTLDAFLPKPFESSQLEAAISEVQQNRASRARANPIVASAEPVSAVSTEEPVLDDKIFAAMARSFRPSQLLELYELTLNDVAERHARLVAAAAAGDLNAVHREAHAVKGACGMVGARELQALAAAVEGGTTLNTSAIADFPAASERLRRMLDAKLQSS